MDVKALADELRAAYASGTILQPPSARISGFDLPAAYAVEAELARARRESGRTAVGRKVGFANKAMWRILKLDSLVWAHMYDDTVRHAPNNVASLSLSGRVSPRLEPEIVFGLKATMPSGSTDAPAVLACTEWIALGFEINDCLFPDWQFRPADFVAAYGLHTALVVGERRPVTPDALGALADQLPRFALQLLRDGELVEEGSGKSSLRSPALCLGELAGLVSRGPAAEPLAAGEIISTGTLTTPQPIAAGETWTARVELLDLPDLTLRLE
ncbi:MAG: 2-keto-4-pentenoate hydratase [Vicinamibacterales bacterium]